MVMLFVALVYTYVWSVVVKLVFIFLWYFFAWDIDTRPPNERTYSLACGMLSGTVFEVSRAYIYFWPEYEGKSSWEKGFENNKKGCGANLVSLNLQMLWPSMEPAYTLEFGATRTPGYLNVQLEPLAGKNLESNRWTHWFLKLRQVPMNRRDKFDSSLGLFYDTQARNILGYERVEVFWTGQGKPNQVVIECDFLHEGVLDSCEQIWRHRGVGALVKVDYAPDMKKHWKQIKQDVDRFVNDHKKNKEGVLNE